MHLPLLGALILVLSSSAHAEVGVWTLRAAVAETLKVHPGVASARRGVDAALAAQLRLLGAYDPSLSASVKRLDAKIPPTFIFQVPRTITDSGAMGLSKRFDLGTTAGIATRYSRERDNITSPFSFNPRYHTGLDLSLNQPLLKGLVGTPERAALRASEAALLAARASHARASESAAAEVGGAYWALWRAREAVAVFMRSAQEAGEFLDTTKRLSKRFEAERDDLLRAEADLLTKELEVLDSKETAEEHAAVLAELTGGDREYLAAALLDNPPQPEQEPVGVSLERALAARADLSAAKAAAARDAQTLAAAEAGFGLPALALSGTLGWAGLQTQASDSLQQLGRFGFRTWSIGLDLAYSFGTRADRGERGGARAEKLFADAAVAALQRGIRRELEIAERRLGVARERVRVARLLINMQEEVLELSQKKYSQGRINSRDRLRDANAALAARNALLGARAEYAQRRIQIIAAEGTLLENLGVSP